MYREMYRCIHNYVYAYIDTHVIAIHIYLYVLISLVVSVLVSFVVLRPGSLGSERLHDIHLSPRHLQIVLLTFCELSEVHIQILLGLSYSDQMVQIDIFKLYF